MFALLPRSSQRGLTPSLRVQLKAEAKQALLRRNFGMARSILDEAIDMQPSSYKVRWCGSCACIAPCLGAIKLEGLSACPACSFTGYEAWLLPAWETMRLP